MTILWAGGEDLDFPNGDPLAVTTISSRFRSGYARCALEQNATGIARSTPLLGGAVTSAWLTTQIYNNSFSVSGATGLFGLVDAASGNKGVYVGNSSVATGRLALYKYDGTTWTLLAAEAATSFSTTNTLYKIDVQISSFGASSTIKVYVDQVEKISFSGDSSISGVTGLDAVALVRNSGAVWVFSEVFVADQDTRTMSCVTLPLNAAGDANAWTGTYADADEITISDSDQLYTNVTGNDVQVNLGNLPSGVFTVKGVQIAARMAKSAGATAGSVGLGVKSGGTINSATAQALAEGYATYNRLMNTNPVTSAAFTPSEIDVLQLNFRSAA